MKVILLKKNRLIVIVVGIIMLMSLTIVFANLANKRVLAKPYYTTNSNKVAITINVDWGEDILPKMLDVFDEKDVKATFFITGRFASNNEELVKEIQKRGHEIGNHGYSHPHVDNLTVQANESDILKSEEVLTKILGERTYLYAPPYGECGESILKASENNGYKVILWSLDTIDWQTPPASVETIVERVSGQKLKGGDIILMHPKENTLNALGTIIDNIRNKGYEIAPLGEII